MSHWVKALFFWFQKELVSWVGESFRGEKTMNLPAMTRNIALSFMVWSCEPDTLLWTRWWPSRWGKLCLDATKVLLMLFGLDGRWSLRSCWDSRWLKKCLTPHVRPNQSLIYKNDAPAIWFLIFLRSFVAGKISSRPWCEICGKNMLGFELSPVTCERTDTTIMHTPSSFLCSDSSRTSCLSLPDAWNTKVNPRQVFRLFRQTLRTPLVQQSVTSKDLLLILEPSKAAW